MTGFPQFNSLLPYSVYIYTVRLSLFSDNLFVFFGPLFQKIETRMTKGAILHLTGFSGDTCTREDIKAAFADHGKVAWVDFEKGQEEVWAH